MSRVQSHERNPLSRPRSPPNGYLGQPLQANSIQAHDHEPFTEEQLALALKRSHLTVPAQA